MSDEGQSVLSLQRDLFKAAIADVQGSLHANDSKASAALIVHGLLLTAVVTVTSRIGPVYTSANSTEQAWISRLVGASLLCFVASVACLLLAVVPLSPSRRFVARLRSDPEACPPQVFFPDLGALKKQAGGELRGLMSRADGLDEASASLEFAFELPKVQRIRARGALLAQFGYLLLAAEIVAVTAYLTIVGGLATDRLF